MNICKIAIAICRSINTTPVLASDGGKPQAVVISFSDITQRRKVEQDLLKTEDTILSEPTVIYQVLMNLCSNAAQAMEKTGGAIVIRMRNVVFDAGKQGSPRGLTSGKYLLLTVADTGPGIDPAIIDRIFDPYFTTKEVGKGTGMGLAVVKGIVESHKGAVSVTSKPGNGATFTVYFPSVKGWRIGSRQQENYNLFP
jgi:signal transduction histidine kinase